MSALSTAPAPAWTAGSTCPSETALRVTQTRVVRSEWTKLRSLRSTLYAVMAAAVLTIGLGSVDCAQMASRWASMSAAERAVERTNLDALSMSLVGIKIGVLALAILGVLAIAGEYSTGMVRSTFAAVPRRLPVLWAKAGVYLLVALAVSIPATLIAFFAGQGLLSAQHLGVGFSQGSVARVVFGSALYLSLSGLLALGLGAILRNTAAGISAFIAVMFILPKLVENVDDGLARSVFPYLPSSAGSAMMQTGHAPLALSPGAGLAVLAGYAVAALALAAVLLVERDV